MSGAGRTVLAALCLVGCASDAKESESRPRAPAEDFGLPPVSAALVFPSESREVSLGWLVAELARLSGQELALVPELRRVLEQTVEPLEQTAPVPAGEVYAFVEALLARQGLLIAPLTAGTRPVLGIYGSPERGGSPRAVAIGPEQVAALAGHPALLCQVLVTFQNLDSRQLQTQLRQLFADSGQHQQVVPAGERSLLVQAGGAKLLGLVELLQSVDRVSVARPSPAEAATLLESSEARATKWPTVPRTQ